MRPPGSRALSFASRWFDPATTHRTFEPLIADWQREWIEAPTARRLWIRCRGFASFVVAVIASTPAIAGQRAPKTLTDQIARRITIAVAIGSLVLMLPFLRGDGPLWFRVIVFVAVIPQALTIVFPFAMVSAVDAIRRFDGLAPHTARATVSKLAMVSCLFVFVCHGWVMPAANQLYRKVTLEQSLDGATRSRYFRGSPAQERPLRGVRELTNSELIMRLSPTSLEPGTNEFARVTLARREISNRATIALLPILVLWRRWRALDLPTGRWFSANHWSLATLAMAFSFAFLRFSDRFVEESWHLPVGSGPWITLALLAAIGIGRVALAERTLERA
jgi:hypothetical protein